VLATARQRAHPGDTPAKGFTKRAPRVNVEAQIDFLIEMEVRNMLNPSRSHREPEGP
jgi:hypothetical protein